MISTAKEFLTSLGYHCPISICPQVMLSSAYDNLSWAVHSLVELLFSPTLGGLLLHTLLFRDFLIELNVAEDFSLRQPLAPAFIHTITMVSPTPMFLLMYKLW